ncbi:MAG: hypothetical protein OXC08_18850 [Thiotrichales bacterium]|nr:hypothetical protein [Thiotrichales bacterium]
MATRKERDARKRLEDRKAGTVARWKEWALVVLPGNRGRYRWSLHHGDEYELRAYSGVNGEETRDQAITDGKFFLDSLKASVESAKLSIDLRNENTDLLGRLETAGGKIHELEKAVESLHNSVMEKDGLLNKANTRVEALGKELTTMKKMVAVESLAAQSARWWRNMAIGAAVVALIIALVLYTTHV